MELLTAQDITLFGSLMLYSAAIGALAWAALSRRN